MMFLIVKAAAYAGAHSSAISYMVIVLPGLEIMQLLNDDYSGEEISDAQFHFLCSTGLHLD